MKWKTWIWWMDVCKDAKWMRVMTGLALEHKDPKWMKMRKEWEYGYKGPKWTWKMNDGKL